MLALSNGYFYTKHAKDPTKFAVLSSMYKKTLEFSEDYLRKIQENSITERVNTFDYIPVQMMDVSSIDYQIKDILSNSSVLEFLENEGYPLKNAGGGWESFPVRKNVWSGSVTVQHKAAVLSMVGKYVDFKRDSTPLTIISLEVYDYSGKKMSFGSDYYFWENKFVLIKSDIRAYPYNTIFFKNLFVDTDKMTESLSSKIPLYYKNSFSKVQFAEILKLFIKNAMIGAQIGALNDSFSQYDPVNNIRIYDFYGATEKERLNWVREIEDEWSPDLKKYGIFDAVVEIPVAYLAESTANSDTKLSNIKEFLEIIRPAHTYVFPHIIISLVDEIGVGDDFRYTSQIYVFGEEIFVKDVVKRYGLVDNIEDTIKNYDVYPSLYGHSSTDSIYEYDNAVSGECFGDSSGGYFLVYCEGLDLNAGDRVILLSKKTGRTAIAQIESITGSSKKTIRTDRVLTSGAYDAIIKLDESSPSQDKAGVMDHVTITILKK